MEKNVWNHQLVRENTPFCAKHLVEFVGIDDQFQIRPLFQLLHSHRWNEYSRYEYVANVASPSAGSSHHSPPLATPSSPNVRWEGAALDRRSACCAAKNADLDLEQLEPLAAKSRILSNKNPPSRAVWKNGLFFRCSPVKKHVVIRTMCSGEISNSFSRKSPVRDPEYCGCHCHWWPRRQPKHEWNKLFGTSKYSLKQCQRNVF